MFDLVNVLRDRCDVDSSMQWPPPSTPSMMTTKMRVALSYATIDASTSVAIVSIDDWPTTMTTMTTTYDD